MNAAGPKGEVIKHMQRFHEDKGFSAWQLVLIFLGAVAVCAVFFSLGFVVGYNHQPASASATTTENVTPSGNIPPTVNPPPGASSQLSEETITPEPIAPSPLAHPQEPSSQSSPPTEHAAPATHKARGAAATSAKRSREAHKSSSRKEVRSKVAAANNRREHFAVQVMASRSKADAITLIKLLEARKYHVFLVPPKQSHGRDNLYRVQVGPFSTRAEAERAEHRLEKEGFKPFVVH